MAPVYELIDESDEHERTYVQLLQKLCVLLTGHAHVHPEEILQSALGARDVSELVISSALTDARDNVLPRHDVAEAMPSRGRAPASARDALVHEMAVVALYVVDHHTGPVGQDGRHLDPPHLVSCDDIGAVAPEVIVG